MSFLLDKLKKSGKQRALEMAMRRQTEKPRAILEVPLFPHAVNRTPLSLDKRQIAAVAVLIVTVAVFGAIAFLRSSSLMQRPVVPAVKGLAQKTSQQPATQLSVPSVQMPRAQEEIVSDAKSPAEEQKHSVAAKASKHVADPEQTGTDITPDEKGKRLPVVLMDAPLGVEPSGSVLAGSVLEFKQLPQAVRKSIPEIMITSHLFRKDSRLVSINGRIMSEGFNMDDGLYLEEITDEGVILSFGKHRFLVRAAR